jgi:hypothetical protein
MDPVFHAVSGFVLAKALPGDHVVAGIIATNMPDLLSFPYIFGVHVRKARKDTFTHFIKDLKRFDDSELLSFPFVLPVYQFAHSIFAWMGVSLVAMVLVPSFWPLLSLGHALHVLVDIPTHDGEFATRVFYPVSDWHISWGKRWTNDIIIFLGMWLFLLVNMVTLSLL